MTIFVKEMQMLPHSEQTLRTEMILKLTLILASLIYQFTWIRWISLLFRETSIDLRAKFNPNLEFVTAQIFVISPPDKSS